MRLTFASRSSVHSLPSIGKSARSTGSTNMRITEFDHVVFLDRKVLGKFLEQSPDRLDFILGTGRDQRAGPCCHGANIEGDFAARL